MKKNSLLITVLLSLLVFNAVYLIGFINNKNNSKIKTEDNLPSIVVNDTDDDGYENKNEDEETPNDYQTAYRKGYNAFLKQLGRTDLIDNQKVYSHTSFIEKDSIDPPSFEENTEEAINRGYTDGYHKASEAIYCPKK